MTLAFIYFLQCGLEIRKFLALQTNHNIYLGDAIMYEGRTVSNPQIHFYCDNMRNYLNLSAYYNCERKLSIFYI